jgi:hypothetical protein
LGDKRVKGFIDVGDVLDQLSARFDDFSDQSWIDLAVTSNLFRYFIGRRLHDVGETCGLLISDFLKVKTLV